jgi:hypothetical protein
MLSASAKLTLGLSIWPQSKIPYYYIVPLLVFVSSHTRLKLFKSTVCVLKLNELVEFIRDRETKRAGGRMIRKGNEVYCPRKSYAGTQSPLGSKEPSELVLSPHTVFVSSKLEPHAQSERHRVLSSASWRRARSLSSSIRIPNHSVLAVSLCQSRSLPEIIAKSL